MIVPVFKHMGREDCTGCECCASVCPHQAILMQEDACGFRYPSLIEERCVNCDKCVRSCPVINQNRRKLPTDTVVGYALDEAIVQASSSGGFFSLIAEKFIANGGIVIGVAWSNDFRKTQHICVDQIEDLTKLRVSKYIQSEKGDIYQQMALFLSQGRSVLFTGCPCEVAAASSRVPERDRNHFFAIDIVCQGPSSAKALREYINWIEKKVKAPVTGINMRYVIGPWIPQYIKITFANGKRFLKRFYDMELGDAMRLMKRPSCPHCQFGGEGRKSDLTLGDYHGADPNASYYHESGVSVAVTHTEKGKQLMDAIHPQNTYLEDADYQMLCQWNPCLEKAWPKYEGSEEFASAFPNQGLFGASKVANSLKRRIFRKLPAWLRGLLRR